MFTAVTVHKMTETEDDFTLFRALCVVTCVCRITGEDQGEFLRLKSATDGAATGHILE